jgi:Helix-turn-helix domain
MSGRPRGSARPAPAPSGGVQAKQRAAVVLAVLSGDCPLAEASRRLGVSVPRYYALERQALQGLVQALEDTKERRRTAVIARQQVQLEHEVLRLQALVRATQRAVALPPPPKLAKRRKLAPRARKVIAQLRLASAADGATRSEE